MHLALLRPDGDNGTASAPISADGYAESGKRYQLPARQGRAVRLRTGDQITIINDSGTQVCDFFALTEGNPGEFLSMEHCRTALGRIYVRAGDSLVTNRRQPVLKIVEDTSPGVHDTLIAACDLPRYRQLGAEGYHDNCADNFQNALLAISVSAPHVPCPFNIWMNIAVMPGGSYEWAAPVSRAGDRIVLRALVACIAVMSACPQDMTAVNGANQTPTGVTFSVEQQPR